MRGERERERENDCGEMGVSVNWRDKLTKGEREREREKEHEEIIVPQQAINNLFSHRTLYILTACRMFAYPLVMLGSPSQSERERERERARSVASKQKIHRGREWGTREESYE